MKYQPIPITNRLSKNFGLGNKQPVWLVKDLCEAVLYMWDGFGVLDVIVLCDFKIVLNSIKKNQERFYGFIKLIEVEGELFTTTPPLLINLNCIYS